MALIIIIILLITVIIIIVVILIIMNKKRRRHFEYYLKLEFTKKETLYLELLRNYSSCIAKLNYLLLIFNRTCSNLIPSKWISSKRLNT